MKHRKMKKKNIINLNPLKSILNPKTSFPVFEAYKAARTSLLALMEHEKCKVIAVTSSLPEEGKTVSTINLALTTMQSGKRVLIIDADMRASKVSKYLRIPSGEGLSDYLKGSDTKLSGLVYKHQNDFIYILPAGSVPENPVELLMHDRMGTLIERLKKQYDYIFIDTPPINVVTDAAAIYHWVTGYLLVVRAGVSDIDAVKEMVLELEKISANILGFFLHDVNSRGTGYGRRYKYSKYDRYNSYSNQYSSKKPEDDGEVMRPW